MCAANDPRLAMLKSLSMPVRRPRPGDRTEPDYPFLDIDNEGAFYDATRCCCNSATGGSR
jgi:LacI family transcriptional regulator